MDNEDKEKSPARRSSRWFAPTIFTLIGAIGAGVVVVLLPLLSRPTKPPVVVAERGPSTETTEREYATEAPRRPVHQFKWTRAVAGEEAPVSRPQPRSPAEARSATLQEIRDTGPSTATWTRDATEALGQAFAHLPSELAGKIHPARVECFERACMVDVVSDDETTAYQMDMPVFAELRRWPGTKHRSPLVPDTGGRVLGTWVVFRASEPPPNQGGI